MRGETICLVVFSAVMGMASVGLTSAHPYEPKPEGEITPLSQQIEPSEVNAKIEEAAKGSAGDVDKFKRWVKAAPEVQETSERLKSDIKKERRARRQAKLGNKAKLADKEWPNFGDKDHDAPSIPDRSGRRSGRPSGRRWG